MVLLDPMDRHQEDRDLQKSYQINDFKRLLINRTKLILGSKEQLAFMKGILNKDIPRELCDTLYEQFIDPIKNLNKYNENDQLKEDYFRLF